MEDDMMRHDIRIVCTLFVLGLSLSGCGVGLNSVLFVTKTQVAVDADTEPPSLDIGYAREEFVLAPAFKDGKVLPVLTTVATEAGAFSFSSSHSFATGDAALVMADALTDDNRYIFTSATPPDPTKVMEPTRNSTVQTSSTDKVPHGFWKSLWFFLFSSSERQRYFFGTDTNLGLHVEWGGSEVPRSVSMGFKRKELAYVPLIESEEPATSTTPATRKVTLASLIATANANTKVSRPNDSGLTVGQTFATGSAATLLASHPGVREVLGPLLVEKYQAIKDALIEWILKSYGNETDQARKQVFIQEAIALKLVPAETPPDAFLKRLGENLSSKAPADARQRLRALKDVMKTKHGYQD
jgi:hypothetical protein